MKLKTHLIFLLAIAIPFQPSMATEEDVQTSCIAALRLIAEVMPAPQPQSDDPECKIDTPVSLRAIKTKSGPIQLPTGMLNACEFALQYAKWIRDVANPLATHHLGQAITTIQSGKGYTCRRRNNLPTGKLSEHAFGNAIDIIGFKIGEDRTYPIKSYAQGTPKSRLLDGLRKSACGYFTTVLSPGSNPAHATHIHLDRGIHGKSGNYRICE